MAPFYALLSQKVNSEEKYYPGLILASNEEWMDFLRA